MATRPRPAGSLWRPRRSLTWMRRSPRAASTVSFWSSALVRAAPAALGSDSTRRAASSPTGPLHMRDQCCWLRVSLRPSEKGCSRRGPQPQATCSVSYLTGAFRTLRSRARRRCTRLAVIGRCRQYELHVRTLGTRVHLGQGAAAVRDWPDLEKAAIARGASAAQ